MSISADYGDLFPPVHTSTYTDGYETTVAVMEMMSVPSTQDATSVGDTHLELTKWWEECVGGVYLDKCLSSAPPLEYAKSVYATVALPNIFDEREP